LVRQFLHHWVSLPEVPRLEKVKAHDDDAVAAGNVKAMGNADVDTLAKEAAAGLGSPFIPDTRFADAVHLRDAAGTPQLDISTAVTAAWWSARCQKGGKRRAWLGQLYPPGLEFDWHSSNLVFRRPVVMGTAFIYLAAPPVLKWVARARSGALNTQRRLTKARLAASPRCLCCSAEEEDDAHAVLGCPGTGSADLAMLVPRLWQHACGKPGRSPLCPSWVAGYLPQLAVGLLPLSIRAFLASVETWEISLILRAFHLSLCDRLAEVLRRRERLRAERSPPSASAVPPLRGPSRSSVRDLTVAEVRAAEQGALASLPVGIVSLPSSVTSSSTLREQKKAAALSLAPWVKAHPHLQAVPLDQGEPSVALLLLWESEHHRPYPCGKPDLHYRLNAFTKRLLDSVAVDTELSAWMTTRKTRMVLSPGLRVTTNTRWAVKIRPEVGEPFISLWKAHLCSLVSQQLRRLLPVQGSPVGSSAPAPKRPRLAAQSQRPKRARSGGPPPLQTKKARLERLRAAQSAQAAGLAPGSSSNSSIPVVASDPAGPATGPRDLPRGVT
jgi:hypothetical protein